MLADKASWAESVRQMEDTWRACVTEMEAQRASERAHAKTRESEVFSLQLQLQALREQMDVWRADRQREVLQAVQERERDRELGRERDMEWVRERTELKDASAQLQHDLQVLRGSCLPKLLPYVLLHQGAAFKACVRVDT